MGVPGGQEVCLALGRGLARGQLGGGGPRHPADPGDHRCGIELADLGVCVQDDGNLFGRVLILKLGEDSSGVDAEYRSVAVAHPGAQLPR